MAPTRYDQRDQEVDSQQNAGRDIYNYYQPRPEDDLGTVGGFARVLLVLGITAGLAGVGMFGFVVVSFIVRIFTSLQAPGLDPPNLSGIPFVPFIPLGVGLVFIGIVLATFGAMRGRAERAKRARTRG